MGEEHNIHPTRKIEVGKRLGDLALAKTYGRDIPALSPRFSSAEVSGSKILVSVCDEPLASESGSFTGFEVCGKDKVFKPATATLEGGRLVVQSASVSEPVAVRYCFRNYQTGSVKGANGLPLMPFRSDR